MARAEWVGGGVEWGSWLAVGMLKEVESVVIDRAHWSRVLGD